MGSAITSEHSNSEIAPDFGATIEPRTESLVFDITDDNETVYWAVTGPEGLSRIEGEQRRRVSCEVVMVVTERRVLFVADTPGGDVDTGALAYSDLVAVDVDEDTLTLTMGGGVRWEFPLPDEDTETVSRAISHLRWIGDLRGKLVASKNDVELGAGEIREHADEREWALATGEYESLREALDQVIVAVLVTEPIPADVLAPELTEIERTLEQAHAYLFIERAWSKLELGRQLVESSDYDQAESVLEAAQAYYERAAGCTEAVERGDEFRFGEQRRLHEELDRLGWELEEVSSEPVRQAQEALVGAEEADEPSEAVDYLETAFRRYQDLLDIDWGEGDRYFGGDREEIRAERTTVAHRLISCHRDLSADCWNAGVRHKDQGDIKDALRQCERAIAHQERAGILATEFQPDVVEDIEQRQEEMERTVSTIRDTAEPDRSGTDDAEVDDEDAESGSADADATSDLGSGVDLTDIDTHQEITLRTTVENDGDLDVPALDQGSNRDDDSRRDDRDTNGEGTSPDEDLSELKRAIIQSDPNEE